MTLIIAGHIDAGNCLENGIFIIADSVITNKTNSGVSPVLGGFNKIYSIPIKIYKPYFIGSRFNGYHSTIYDSYCFVAIAGNTLTLQYILNIITDYLGKLRFSYKRRKSYSEKIEYTILRYDEDNPLCDEDCTYGDDIFTQCDYTRVFSNELVINIIKHCIQVALESALKYKCEDNKESLKTQLIVGTYCFKENSYNLTIFETECDTSGSEAKINVLREDISSGHLAVIGLSEYTEKAAKKYLDAINNSLNPIDEMTEFLKQGIKEFKKEDRPIDFPVFVKKYISGKLKLIKVINETY